MPSTDQITDISEVLSNMIVPRVHLFLLRPHFFRDFFSRLKKVLFLVVRPLAPPPGLPFLFYLLTKLLYSL